MIADDRALLCQRLPVVGTIPLHRVKLLFISHNLPRGHAFGFQINISQSFDGKMEIEHEEPDDPSTIYSCLPVCVPKSNTSVPKLPYFPSYSNMTCEQRGIYLRWLSDISNTIDIGYVFVYYYGLERHLVKGDFDAAVDEIITLRKYHSHSSFQFYSASALVHACLIRKRIDTLERLYASSCFDFFDNSNLLIFHYSGLDLSLDVMFRLASRLKGVNRRYMRENPEFYRQVLAETLLRRFGKESYPFSDRFCLEKVKRARFPIFANISLPPSIRTPDLPNFLHHGPFKEELGMFFREVHETRKKRLKSSASCCVVTKGKTPKIRKKKE